MSERVCRADVRRGTSRMLRSRLDGLERRWHAPVLATPSNRHVEEQCPVAQESAT